MRLEELHKKIEGLLNRKPEYRFRTVFYWQGKTHEGKDIFETPREIIPCTIKMSPGSTTKGIPKCVVLAPSINSLTVV